jgi:Aldo/keto reductase family
MKLERQERRRILVFPNALLRYCAQLTPVWFFLFFSPFLRLKVGSLLTVLKAAKVDAMQAEYSAFETVHETDGLIETARESGVTYVAYSPLGHGWLVDNFDYKSPDDFAADDFRRKGTPLLDQGSAK